MHEVPNKFVWYDLATTDMGAAESFYRAVIGWNTADAGIVRPYTLFSVGDIIVGGVMAMTEEMRAAGAPPTWIGHIGVDELDETLERLKAAGGLVRRPPENIPGVGRFAVMADPHGASFVLFQGSGIPMISKEAPGFIGWRELFAGDWEEAFDFYSGLFGWTKAEAVDMGAMGTYQTFAAGGPPIGGMMTRMPEMPVPFWLYYFYVDTVDGAVQRVAANGGKLVMRPIEVPGGGWIAQFLDPQGAMFAVVGPKS
jgi:predicted enzyme related to lactoylglutathione lyase